MGKTNLSKKDNLVYVGVQSPTHRLGDEKEKEKKKEEKELKKDEKNKIRIRKVEDGLLMVVVVAKQCRH